MKKIVFLVMTTEKNNQRIINIKSTWGKDVDVFFYSEHENLENNIIKVTNINHPEVKQCEVFKTIKNNLIDKYEWFFFSDDDTFVNVNLLLNKLNSFSLEKVHGQDIFGCYGDLHYPSGGAGFLISNKIISNFFDIHSNVSPHSDTTLGLFMRKKSIDIENCDLFKSQPPSFYKIDNDNVKNYISFHYINNFEHMNLLYNLCKKNMIS
jgi:hypothetical protein